MASHTALTAQAQFAASMYDQRATQYEDSWHPDFVYDFLDRLHPPIEPGQSILDLACGTGLVTFLAAGRTGRHGQVLGIDISTGMLEQASRRKQTGHYPHVTFHHHNITQLEDLAEVVKVRDQLGGFDLITCASAFVLLDDPDTALLHWVGFLKPGGRLLLDVTNPHDQIVGVLMEQVGNILGVPVPWHRTWVKGPESLQTALQKVGLDVRSIDFVAQGKGEVRYLTVNEIAERWVITGTRIWKDQLAQKGLEDRAFDLFKQQAAAWAVDGKLKEVDGVYVGIGVKPISASQKQPRLPTLAPLPTSITMQNKPSQPLYTGGCRCGAVKWSAFNKPDGSICYCHCLTCRQISGSYAIPFIGFAIEATEFSSGTDSLQVFAVTPYAERSFCQKCGSNMTMRYRREADFVYFPLGTLNEQSGQQFDVPFKHIMLREKASWFKLLDDGLERHDGMPASGLLDD